MCRKITGGEGVKRSAPPLNVQNHERWNRQFKLRKLAQLANRRFSSGSIAVSEVGGLELAFKLRYKILQLSGEGERYNRRQLQANGSRGAYAALSLCFA